MYGSFGYSTRCFRVLDNGSPFIPVALSCSYCARLFARVPPRYVLVDTRRCSSQGDDARGGTSLCNDAAPAPNAVTIFPPNGNTRESNVGQPCVFVDGHLGTAGTRTTMQRTARRFLREKENAILRNVDAAVRFRNRRRRRRDRLFSPAAISNELRTSTMAVSRGERGHDT